jgi:hypothetical protein
MSSKEQTHRNDKVSSRQRSPKPIAENPDRLAPQQSDPAAIFQRAMNHAGSLTPLDVLRLQRTVGNRVVSRLLAGIRSRPSLQARLTVGAAGDRYEQEADRIADQVMNMPRPAGVQHLGVNASPDAQRQEDEELQTKPLAASITPLAQRQAEEEEEIQATPLAQRQAEEEEEEVQAKPLAQRQAEEEEVQAKPSLQPSTAPGPHGGARAGDLQASLEAGSEIESRLAASKGGGSPLPDEVRATMEPRFGADFSGVRLHTGGEAAQLSQDLSAQAFTHGEDIYLGAGQYSPGTSEGQRLLAHELTHVVQQGAAQVRSVGNRAIVRLLKGTVQRQKGIIQRVKSPEARQAFLKEYPKASALVEGIDVNRGDTQILDALVQNYIARSGFVYDMSATLPETFLAGRKQSGDCSTLSGSFVKIAKDYFDIQGISCARKKEDFGIADGGPVLDANGVTGNVDHGSHWAFTEHTWVVGPDRTRDILFLGVPVNESGWIEATATGKEDGIEYREFTGLGGGRVYDYLTMGSLIDRYTTNLELAKVGQRQTEEGMKALTQGPRSRPKKKGKLCFITTACIQAKGLPDDCEELTVLRAFRDGYLLKKANGRQLVELYYRHAPRIVKAIAEQENTASIYDQLYEVIRACVEAIKRGDNEFAYTTYCRMVTSLKEQYVPDVVAPAW